MDNWPIYYRERLWLGNLIKGDVGIATLWTPKESLVALLKKAGESLQQRVAVVGQLYTQRGAEFIFRNLWANPRVSTLIITGTNLTDSYQPLLKPDHDLWQQFPRSAVKRFFQGVKILDWRDWPLAKVIQELAQLTVGAPFSPRARQFAETKAKAEIFPAEESVFRFQAPTIGQAWLPALQAILRFGRRVPRIHLYGGQERTLLNLALVITEEDPDKPKIWPFFNFDRQILHQYYRGFFQPDRGEEAYTYGERLFRYPVDDRQEFLDQVTIMAKKLRQFPYNKGALATLWQPAIDNFPKRRPWRTPCLVLVQAFCLEEKLHLTAYFRSNDIFGAWPLNAFALRKLQAGLAQKLGFKMGVLTTISQTAFIDEGDLAPAESLVKKHRQLLCQTDPRGNLVIEVVGSEIVVRHLAPDGAQVLAEYRQDGRAPKAALKLAQKLLLDQVISRVDHALDIGEQLGRAEDAVKLGLKFEQDQPLKRNE